MKNTGLMMLAAMFSLTALPVMAHEVPNIKHSHAFEQTGYGKYRQGHYVNGARGDIIIWSAQPKTGYKPGPAVKFARPEPITRAPAKPSVKPAPMATLQRDYGKPKNY